MSVLKLFILMMLAASNASALEWKARIFSVGKTNEKPLFIQETKIQDSENGQKVWSSQIKDSNGQIIMTEEAHIKEGQVVFQYVEQLQIEEAYELKILEGQATFQTFEMSGGKKSKLKKSNVIEVKESFLMGPSTEIYLQQQWSKLLAGEKLKVNFGIFEILKPVGFQFQKVKENQNSIEIQMKPSNMFLSMMVKPIQIELSRSDKRMIRFVGRTPIRVRVDGQWKPLDAEILYP